jgi:hypothetical protein
LSNSEISIQLSKQLAAYNTRHPAEENYSEEQASELIAIKQITNQYNIFQVKNIMR